MADGTVIRRDDLPESVAPRTQEVHRSGSLRRHRAAAAGTDVHDLIGRVEREYFCAFALAASRATSPELPGTAGCRGGA